MKIFIFFISLIISTKSKLFPQKISPFIIDGEVAKEGEFPFVVAIKLNQQTECGGILIREDFVLTTSNCIRGNNLAYYVVGGVTDLSNNEDPNRQMIPYEKMIPYDLSPDFRVTLIKLETNFTLTNTVKVIDLTNEVPEGEVNAGIVVGWGSNSTELPGFDGSIPILHKTKEISILENSTCLAKFPGYANIPKFEADVNFCGGNENSGPCPVDGGGPFLVGENKNILYGVFERGERQRTLPFLPNICAVNGITGMYIRVLPIIPWIRQKLEQNPPAPPTTTTEKQQTTTSTTEVDTTTAATEDSSTTEIDATTEQSLMPTTTNPPYIITSSTDFTTDAPTTFSTEAKSATDTKSTSEDSSEPSSPITEETLPPSTPGPPLTPTDASADTTEDSGNTTIVIVIVSISTLTCIVNCAVFGIVLFQHFKIKDVVSKRISKYLRESDV